MDDAVADSPQADSIKINTRSGKFIFHHLQAAA